MFCPECGAPAEQDALFCQDCGSELGREGGLAGKEEELYATTRDEVEPADGSSERIRAASPDAPEPGTGADSATRHPQEGEPALAEERVASPARAKARRQSRLPARAPAPPTSGLAIASFVLGIGGLTVLPLLGSIVAVLLGYLARSEIRRQPGEIAGDGLAVAGIVMGWIAIGAALVVYLLALLGLTAGVCCLGPCGIASLAGN